MLGKKYYSVMALRIIVIISAVVGTFLSAYAGRDSFMGGKSVFMYFTIQSNIALAITCGVGLFFMAKKRITGKAWDIIRLVATVSITLTGVVFCFVLAPTMGSDAWNFQNVLTHVVVPIASVADFMIAGTKHKVEIINVLWVIVPPIIYAIYAGIGYMAGWHFSEDTTYPYFFLNWGSPAGAFGFTNELPFMGCMWWIIALFTLLLIVGYLYLTGNDKRLQEIMSYVNGEGISDSER